MYVEVVINDNHNEIASKTEIEKEAKNETKRVLSDRANCLKKRFHQFKYVK